MNKVLHFVSSPDLTSGVMSVIMNYFRHIDRRKFSFDFLCFIKPEEGHSFQPEIEALGGRVYFIPKPGGLPSKLNPLFDFFRNHTGEYQWLHNHEVYLSWLLRPVSREYGIKNFIVHCHATRYSDRPVAALRNRILCLPIRYMGGIHRFACSEDAAVFLYGEEQVHRGQVFIMQNAIEVEHYGFSEIARENVRQSLGYHKDDILLGNIGRLTPQKNQKFLLQVMKKLQTICQKETGNQQFRYRLLIIGEGGLEQSLKEQAQVLGIGNLVRFYGRSDEIPAMMSGMDLFLLPSVFEGLGNVLIEAQSNDLPCLASEHVPQEAFVSDCIKALPLDDDIWARGILGQFAREGGERQRRGVRGASERMLSSAYNIKKAVQRYEGVLRKNT